MCYELYIIYLILCKDVPVTSLSSSSYKTNLISSDQTAKYAFLLNNYVQRNASVIGIEFFCPEQGKLLLRVIKTKNF